MAGTLRELSQDERLALEVLAANDGGDVGRRARAILCWQDGADPDRAAALSGLRPAQVRHWAQAFARLGLRVFSPGTPTIGGSGMAQPAERAATEAPPPPGGTGVRRRARGPRIRSTDPIVEALRRILALHFGRVRRLARAAFEADEEAIHDMRVAIRRLRAALRIARPYFRRKRLQGLRARLRETAEALGAVRDHDVLLAHALEYAGRQEDGKLEEWIDALRARRAEALQTLREHLAGKGFRRLLAEFRTFLAEVDSRVRGGLAAAEAGTPADRADSPVPARVREVLPAALWEQYSVVRAHEAVEEPTAESLHILRIEIKRFRYLLEFFQGVLGVRVVPAIELAVRAQDHLGRLHDAWVAAGRLRQHIGTSEAAGEPIPSGAADYLAELTREMDSLAAAFPELWRQITDVAFRRRLARALARV